MKKVFLLMAMVLPIVFSSCSCYYTELVSRIDYVEYLDRGIVVVPNGIDPVSTGKEFVPISKFEIKVNSGNKIDDSLKNKNGIISKKRNNSMITNYYATNERIVDLIVSQCKSLGANGIVNFSLSMKDNNWLVSGTAVKFE